MALRIMTPRTVALDMTPVTMTLSALRVPARALRVTAAITMRFRVMTAAAVRARMMATAAMFAAPIMLRVGSRWNCKQR